ncbi:MAG: membrane-bound lytic murein transglycosylase F [Gammaproteobacteria bacterium]|jgi:membrane-bound lytic murein transglycosylase F
MPELSSRAHLIQLGFGLLAVLFIVTLFIVKPGMERDSMSVLEKIQLSGKLRVITLNSASTYFQDNHGPNGFEFQLASLFSESIGVTAEFVTVSQFADLYPELLFGSGDIIAAGLSENESEFSSAVAYGPRYFESANQVLYRKGSVTRPRKLADLTEGELQVVSGTSQVKLLTKIQQQHPELVWLEVEDAASEELIEQVDSGEVSYLLADSHQIALQRRFFPELRVAFELGEPKQLRWAFNHADDTSLANAVDRFFDKINEDGRLEQLIHRHYSHVAKFNYSDIQTFTGHIRERLPRYEALFRREAKEVGVDWRLIASIGYQESLWDARAKSPTGVRGLMMLTRATAKQMEVKNRLDPAQSIRGGARYFARVLKRIPSVVAEPDRTWFALASYNVGFGHVQDARKLTEQNNGDPNRWIDVKKTLPLLARKKWYKQTKYGYARGWEPVKYVENIRSYYEYLSLKAIRSNSAIGNPGPQNDGEIVPLAPSL